MTAIVSPNNWCKFKIWVECTNTKITHNKFSTEITVCYLCIVLCLITTHDTLAFKYVHTSFIALIEVACLRFKQSLLKDPKLKLFYLSLHLPIICTLAYIEKQFICICLMTHRST